MKKFLITLVLFILFISWGIYDDLQTETPNQQFILDQIRELGSQKIYGIDIVIANTNKGIIEKKSLSHQEIVFVKELLRNADTKAVGGHNFLTYTCTVIFYLDEARILTFSGENYGQYNYNKEDLYLTPEYQSPHKNQNGFYKRPKPIRIRSLGKWIATHVKTVNF